MTTDEMKAREAAAKAAWVAQNGDGGREWAERVVDDVFSPADDWPQEAMDAADIANAAIESSDGRAMIVRLAWALAARPVPADGEEAT